MVLGLHCLSILASAMSFSSSDWGGDEPKATGTMNECAAATFAWDCLINVQHIPPIRNASKKTSSQKGVLANFSLSRDCRGTCIYTGILEATTLENNANPIQSVGSLITINDSQPEMKINEGHVGGTPFIKGWGQYRLLRCSICNIFIDADGQWPRQGILQWLQVNRDFITHSTLYTYTRS